MKVLKIVGTYVLLPLLILWLGYLIVDSVMQPVRFEKTVDQRKEIAVQRLKDIRTLQVAYKTEYGQFLSTADSLVDFYKNGVITVVKQIGSMDDSLAVAKKLVRRDSIKIAVKDTLLKERARTIDSLLTIPFSGGMPIHMDAIVKQVSGVNVPLFEAYMSFDEVLQGLDKQLIINLKATQEDMGRYPGYKVGSITNPNNNAGNWE